MIQVGEGLGSVRKLLSRAVLFDMVAHVAFVSLFLLAFSDVMTFLSSRPSDVAGVMLPLLSAVALMMPVMRFAAFFVLAGQVGEQKPSRLVRQWRRVLLAVLGLVVVPCAMVIYALIFSGTVSIVAGWISLLVIVVSSCLALHYSLQLTAVFKHGTLNIAPYLANAKGEGV